MKNLFKFAGLLIALLILLTALPVSAQGDATPEPEVPVIDPASPPEVVVTEAPPIQFDFSWYQIAAAIIGVLGASTVIDDLYKYLVRSYFRPIKADVIATIGVGGWNVVENIVQAAALTIVETYGKEAVNHILKGFDVMNKSLAKAGIETKPEDRDNLELMLSNKVRAIVLQLRE